MNNYPGKGVVVFFLSSRCIHITTAVALWRPIFLEFLEFFEQQIIKKTILSRCEKLLKQITQGGLHPDPKFISFAIMSIHGFIL